MTIDLDTTQSVSGGITQGQADFNQWVISYKVSFSTDNITYLYITTTGTTTDSWDLPKFLLEIQIEVQK